MQRGLEYSESIFRRLRLLEIIIDSLTEGVAVGHQDGGLVLFNTAAREILGQSLTKAPREEWSQHYGIFYSDGTTLVPEHELPMVVALNGRTVQGFEMFIRNPSIPQGRMIVADAHPIPPDMAIVVFRDITAERNRELAMQSAKEAAESANRAKTEFLANMSHEIRTPLGAILGFSELLAESHLTTGDSSLWVANIHRNAEHLSSLVDGILDLSKIESGLHTINRDWTPLLSILEDALEPLRLRARSKGLEFDFQRAANLPERAYIDEVALRRILINIVGNAIKFTDKGTIRISAQMASESLLMFEVRDTGIGISPGVSHRLFKPFSQGDSSMSRRYGGTGLGLIVSKRLAQSLGGDLELTESRPGAGSTFRITLRIVPEGRLETSASVATPPRKPERQTDLRAYLQTVPLRGLRILVVEDNRDIQLILQRLLARAGADVVCADDGDSGIAKALSADVDVVLMDIQMPKMDGYQATRELRQRGFQKPILALTAHALSEERLKCLEAGCNDYLSKPVNPYELVSRLRGFCSPLTLAKNLCG